MTLLICFEVCDATRQWNNTYYDFILGFGSKEKTENQDILIVAIDDDALAQLGPWPWSRDQLAKIAANLGEAKARSVTFDILMLDESEQDADLSDAMSGLGEAYLPLSISTPGNNGAPFNEHTPPAVLSQAASGLGHVGVTADTDGVVRRVDRRLIIADREWPHLGVLAAGQEDVLSGPPQRLLHFSGNSGSFPTVSASAVALNHVAPELIAGRDVLVGATAPGLEDRYAVPVTQNAGLLTGVELLANVVVAERYGLWIMEPGLWLQIALQSIAIGLVWVAYVRFSTKGAAVTTVVVFFGLLSGSWAAMTFFSFWLAPMSGVLVIGMMAPVLAWSQLAQVRASLLDQIDILNREVSRSHSVSLRAPRAVDDELGALERGITQLRRLRATLDDFLGAFPEPTLALDQSNTIIYCNRRANDLWHSLSADSRPKTILDFLHPFVRASTRPSQESTVGNPEPNFDGMELETPDGRHFLVSTTKMSDDSGGAVILNFADVTVLTGEIDTRRNVLEFLSHDLRAPLASASEWLSRSDGGANNVALQNAKKATDRALILASSYVELVRSEKSSPRLEVIELRGIIDEAVDAVWQLAREKRVRIECDPVADSVLVKVDRSAIVRALVNLLGNAITHGSQTGDRVTVGQSTDGNKCVVSVGDSDTSSVEAIRKLLALRQGWQSLSSSAGLGLPFARIAIAKSGGVLTCERTDTQKFISIALPKAATLPTPGREE